MFEYFLELPLMARFLWILSALVINILADIYLSHRTLKTLKKTNSPSLSLNVLRRMNSYIVVPLCAATTILLYILIPPLAISLNEYVYAFSLISSIGLGILLLFIRNLFICSTVKKVAVIKNIKNKFHMQNLKIYIFIYILTSITMLGITFINTLPISNDITKLFVILGCVGSLILIEKLISKKFYKNIMKPSPMEDCELKNEILAMADTIGCSRINIETLDEADSYFGPAAATTINHGTIYLTDTLLKRLTPEETKSVVAHELGHIKYKHIQKRIFTYFIGYVVGICLYLWLKVYCYWYEPETIFIIVGVYCLIYFVFITKYLSRKQERQADAFVIKMGSSLETFKTSLLKLENLNDVTMDYGRAEEIFLTHPTLKKRIKYLIQLEN